MWRLITLTTDFGTRDSFVGVMKGVIISINPSVQIVDITHEISPQNIREASFSLLTSHSFFPPGTIHTVVVDPGVGSKRRCIAVETRDYYFVLPDNGIITPLLKKVIRVVELNREEYFRKPVSFTFHGRDIFAPVSAYLSLGKELEELGDPIPLESIQRIPWNEPEYRGEEVEGEILHIDRFGNLITSLEWEKVKKWAGGRRFVAFLKGEEIIRLVTAYQDEREAPFLIPGSSGYLEVSLYGRRAKDYFSCGVGEKIILRILPQ